jgi:hypothetical protein
MIERELQYDDGMGASVVLVRFSQPEIADVDWKCTCTISGKAVSKELTHYGVDSFQAFVLTVRMADAWLRSLPAFRSGRLYFSGGADGVLLETLCFSASGPNQ